MTDASLLVSYQFEPGNRYHDLTPKEKRAIDQKLMQKLLTNFPVRIADGLMKVKLADAYPDREMLKGVVTEHLPEVQSGYSGGTLALSEPEDWSSRYVAIPPNEHRHYATVPLTLAGGSVGAAHAGYTSSKRPAARLNLDEKEVKRLAPGLNSTSRKRGTNGDSTREEKPWDGARLVVSLSWREDIADSDLPMDAKILRLQKQVAALEARLSGAPPVDPFSFHNPHNPS